MWVARDKDKVLWLYQNKPRKRVEIGIWDSFDECMEIIEALSDCFSEVQWEDDEPTEVKLVKK